MSQFPIISWTEVATRLICAEPIVKARAMQAMLEVLCTQGQEWQIEVAMMNLHDFNSLAIYLDTNGIKVQVEALEHPTLKLYFY